MDLIRNTIRDVRAYLNMLNGKMIIAANVRRLFTELCTALPISINASTGIPKAFPYAGSNTNALIKHATTAVSTVPTAIPITAWLG